MFWLADKKFPIFIILTAFLVGALYLLPPFLVGQKLKSLNKPFVLLQLENHSDEVVGYVYRAREIYEGKFPAEPRIFPQLTSIIFAGFVGIFGGNINNAYLAANFVFAALIFLTFYFIGWTFLKNKFWALFAGIAGALTPMATHLPYAFENLNNFANIVLKNFYPGVVNPLVRLFHSRIDNPLLTLPFYLLAIAAFYIFWQKPSIKKAIFGGTAIGILPYIYFHYWAYLVITSALLGCYLLATIRTNREKLKIYLVFLSIILLLSAPYFINYWQFKSQASPDFFGRLGLEHGHNFRFSKIFEYGFYTLLAILVYLVIFKKDQSTAVFFWGFILAMFAVWNLQVILGFQPELKWDRAISPLVFLILLAAVYQISLKIEAKKAAVILLLLTSLLVTKKIVNAALFINPAPEFLQEHTFSSGVIYSWDWILKNLPKQSVVISPSFKTSHYLGVYTSAMPFLRPGLGIAESNIQLENRFLISHKLFGVSEAVLEKQIKDTNVMIDLYYNYYKNQSFDIDYRNDLNPALKIWQVPEIKIRELLERYDRLTPTWKDFAGNYVYLGPWERSLTSLDLSKEKDLKLVYQNDQVAIYQIRTR